MSRNQRKEERISTVLPVTVGGTKGITRDVSATGIFFETDTAELVAGSDIRLTVQFEGPAGDLVLNCVGKIVRVESRNPGIGVAVKITESEMSQPLVISKNETRSMNA